ncbi:hypothetical protein RLOatenuis_6730 [Rickettsiales bacterium]|nr:hypothetical protein RLOatenuis_6730 [Rickettsiales bacterium]
MSEQIWIRAQNMILSQDFKPESPRILLKIYKNFIRKIRILSKDSGGALKIA